MKRYSIQQTKEFLVGFGIDLLIAFVSVTLITLFVVQNQRVQGNSMAPTMHHGDMVVMNKWIYHFSEPELNDIVGFYVPRIGEQVVKRIVGEPGDIIDYKDGMLYRNEVPIVEQVEDSILDKGNIEYPCVVPDGQYFVLGDNYNESIDSRYHYIGTIPKESITGRIDIRVWPLGYSPLLNNK